MGDRVYPLVFYNLRAGRPDGQVANELRAILGWRPAVFGMCEAVGYSLPDVDDYVKIRDTSTKSRANVAAYVKASLDLAKVQWHDLSETWSRTEHPGTHEPRSYLEFRAGQMQVLVGHQCPKGTDNTHDAQMEGIDLLTNRMAPWTRDNWAERDDDDKADAKAQRRVVLWDANRGPKEDGPGPKMLADRIDGATVGTKIDGAVKRKGYPSDVSYPGYASGVELCSDHGCCFRFDFHMDDE